MTRPDLRIAISGFDGLDVPHPGAAVARALREGWDQPIEIHALGYDPFMTGAWMEDAVDELHTLPVLSKGDGALLERLVGLSGRFGFDALIPTLDLEVPIVARLAARLESVGLKTLLPSPESIYATTKLRLPKFCHDHGIQTPRTIHVLDLEDLTLHANQFGYPLFVKGTVAGAKRVHNAAQAQSEAEELHKKWGGGVLLQEALSGEEYNVAGIIGRDGEIRAITCIRKVGVNEKGKGIVCTVVDDPDIEKEALTILKKLNWAGPVELEFLRPPGSKSPYLIEVNCRFPSWILLSHWAGCNLPAIYLAELLGHKSTPHAGPKAGTTFVRDINETAVPLAQIEALARFGSCPGTPRSPMVNRRSDPEGIRVAVSGVGTLDVVNAGLGVARALRLAPGIGRIYGLGYGNFDSGLYRPELFDAGFRLAASDDAGVLLDRLAAINAEHPFDVVIPCLDGEIPRFIEIADDLEAIGIRSLLPGNEVFEARNKKNLFASEDRVSHGGFAIPATILVRSEKEVEQAVRELGFPVALKGPISHAFAAHSLDEARAAWTALREKGCSEALVQEFIAGERFAVAAVCDREHRAASTLAIKKLRVCDRGSTWSAVSVDQAALQSSFTSYLETLEWVGPVEGEFIRDEVSEQFYLIEVNPRFTGWISFSAHLGLNHPLAAVRMAMGLAVEARPAVKDLVFMRSCEDAPVNNSAVASIATKGIIRHG